MSTIVSPSATSVALNEIELLAKDYAAARAALGARSVVLNDEVQAIYRRKIRGIQDCAAEAAACQARLVAAVQAHPEFFKQPRTMTLYGIKLGYQKGKGKIEWSDEEKLIERIHALGKSLSVSINALVSTKESASKEGLALLTAAELKKLGVVVTEAGDFVLVKAADTEVDKLVTRILKEGAIEEAAATE